MLPFLKKDTGNSYPHDLCVWRNLQSHNAVLFNLSFVTLLSLASYLSCSLCKPLTESPMNLLSPLLVLFSSPIFSLITMKVHTPGLCVCHKSHLPCRHQFSLPGCKNKHLQTTASSTSATSGWCIFNSG